MQSIFNSYFRQNLIHFKGEPCEIIKSQDNIPGIVIHPCSDANETTANYGQKKRFINTRRPNPNDFS